MTIPDDRQLGDALTEASRDIRPVDLWERLREPTAEIAVQQARRYRFQAVSNSLRWVGAVAALLLLTFGTYLTLNRVRPATGPSPAVNTRVPTALPSRQNPTAPPSLGPSLKPGVGQGGVLRANIGAYPDTLDPHQASFLNEVQVLKLVYEGLTKLDKDLNVVGGAAESWKVAEDGVTWTFILRPNLTYSDGTPLTAKNFEYALKRAASPQVGGQYQSSTFDILGAEEYGTADLKTMSADALVALRDKMAVQAVDDHTLVIRTRAPIAYFPSVMSLWIAYPVREDILVKAGETWWQKAENHIGNGPFKLQTLIEPQSASFVPNLLYYDPPKLGRIDLRFMTDSKVVFDAYKNDELDLIHLAADDLDAVMRDPTLSQQVVRYGGSCTLGFFFNMSKPPFNNRDARLAIAKGIDREQFVRDLLRGIGRPTTSWIPAGLPDHNPEAGRNLAYDPAAARALWQRVGYKGEIKLTYGSGVRTKARFEFIADQIVKNLGATATLDPVEPTALSALGKSLETHPMIALGGWCADYPDPQNWMSVYWDSKGFAARYGYKNETVDRLQRVADAEPDALRRTSLYQEAEKLVLEDVGVAPLYHSENIFLVKPYVKGYITTAQDHLLGEFTITEMTANR